MRLMLFLYGLIACGIPLSRVLIGPMPLYFVDVIAIVVIVLGRGHLLKMYRRHKKITVVILLFALSLLPTSFSEYLRMSPLEPTYILGRTMLHMLAVLALTGYLREKILFRSFLTGLAVGALITSTVAIMNSLPVTGPWVRANVFTIPVIFPQRSTGSFSSDVLMKLDAGEAERGNSLAGKSNVTGFVLIAVLPFLIGASRYMSLGKFRKLLFNTAIIATLFALLFTYSRLTYLALALLMIGYFIFDRQIFAKRFVPVSIVIAVVIGIVGFQSDAFKFTFIAEKFDLSNERYAYTNMARIYAYTVPFKIVYDHPLYLVRGAGRTDVKLRQADEDATILELYKAEMHSVFAASVFYRGFLSMLLFFYLYFILFKASLNSHRQARRIDSPATWIITSSLVSLISISPPWAFDHYLVTKMSAHMYLFVIIALILAGRDMHEQFVKSGSKPNEHSARKDILSGTGQRILSRARPAQ